MVAHPDQLVQAVRNVDDADALRFQLGDDAEQHLDLGSRQGAGRFVQDQDAGVLRQGLGDFDDLLLADPEVIKRRVGVDVLFQPLHQRPRGPALSARVDVDARPDGFMTDEDILGHGQVREQVQLLKDDADPGLDRIGLAAELDLAACHFDPAFGQCLDPSDDLHQRGLARAVFAHQHVDCPHPEVEVHAFQRAGAGVDLHAAPD